MKWQYKIKTFKYIGSHEMEETINKWLHEQNEHKFKLINISTTTQSRRYVYTIMYKELID